MSDALEPPERPRTWIPLVGAAVAAVIVLAVALSTVFFGDHLSDTEESIIEACEAEYARTDGVPIFGGQVYVPPQMRDYYAVAETHGRVPQPLDDVPEKVLQEWEQAGEKWVDTGVGPVVLVWRHDNNTYTQCSADFTADGIVSGSLKLGPLEVTDLGSAMPAN